MRLSSRMEGVRGEGAFDVLVKARALEAKGHSIIHMEIGEPDFPTPVNIVEAGRQALADGWTKYGATQGDPELREVIAELVSKTRGISVSEQNVVVTPGGKPILFFPLLALLEPGDEVLYPNPSFPIYESVIRYCGATPVPLPLVEERGFSLDLDMLRAKLSPRTKVLMINSPQNPTGGVIPEEDIRAIAELVRDRDIMVLSDEVYSNIYFDRKPFSIASLPGMVEKTIILDGFSKTYSMTGWRMGYGVMPKWLVDGVCLMMVNCVSHTASFSQRAGIEALTGPQEAVIEMVAEFKRRREVIVEGFNRIPGFSCTMPGGAFYAFPNVKKTGIPSDDLADRILNEAGVACLTGTSFGSFGEGYLRFSYATALDQIHEALDRIDRMMRGILG
ncbi:MAG: pyridoxal phosphate-dependent aminotransferase [Bryobacterales bacterium]|nr:pyridoxal phosphate-dependent aminotransferase [Bryobacterales bacterium]MDE0293558.1 pyridoxal phosphate-dependent aminotransferase [Bryobacterales bacterium]